MSRRSAIHAAVLVTLAVASAVVPARASQERERDRVERHLARVESLLASTAVAERSLRQREADARRPRVARSGRLVLVLWRAVPSRSTDRIAALADSILGEFGVVPPALLDSIALVQAGTSDVEALLETGPLARRARVELDWNPSSGEEAAAWLAARAVGMYFRTRLDTTWTAHWLKEDYGIGWTMERDGGAALDDLTRPAFAVGERCLAGVAGACRQWLGLDAADSAHARRYTMAEIRRYFATLDEAAPGLTGLPCIRGDDEVCLTYAERSGLLSPIPSTDRARAAFVRAVAARHGPEAVRRALLDRRGTIGERFARATGVSEDSLALYWRAWMLGRGRTDRVRADAGTVAAAMGALIVLLGLATRSGRWHS